MKKRILFTALVLTLSFFSTTAQKVEGRIKINGSSEKTIDLESNYAVLLFKEFKEGIHKIMFSFDGDGYRTIESAGGAYPPQVPKFNFFKFKTTIKHNGRTIGSIDREPMPYLPGDMLLPAETFDFINILGTYKQDGMAYGQNTTAMPSGKYEVILEAQPVAVDGRVSRGIILFNIN